MPRTASTTKSGRPIRPSRATMMPTASSVSTVCRLKMCACALTRMATRGDDQEICARGRPPAQHALRNPAVFRIFAWPSSTAQPPKDGGLTCRTQSHSPDFFGQAFWRPVRAHSRADHMAIMRFARRYPSDSGLLGVVLPLFLFWMVGCSTAEAERSSEPIGPTSDSFTVRLTDFEEEKIFRLSIGPVDVPVEEHGDGHHHYGV